MEEKQTENTIDLTHLFQLLRRHIWALILWSVGLAVVGWGIATFVITPKYTSTAQILVNQRGHSNDPNAAYTTQNANMQLVTTYKDIVTSNKILTAASKRLANPTKVVKKAIKAVYKTDDNGNRKLVKKAQPAVVERTGKTYIVSAGELASNVSVATQTQSQVFSINAVADTPEKAKAEVNAVAETFKDQVPKIMDINNVTIVARGTNGAQTSPNVKLFTLAGFVIGLVLSLAVIIIRDMTNTTVRDDEYLTQELGLINLGQVAHFNVPAGFKFNANKKSGNNGKNKRRRV